MCSSIARKCHFELSIDALILKYRRILPEIQVIHGNVLPMDDHLICQAGGEHV